RRGRGARRGWRRSGIGRASDHGARVASALDRGIQVAPALAIHSAPSSGDRGTHTWTPSPVSQSASGTNLPRRRTPAVAAKRPPSASSALRPATAFPPTSQDAWSTAPADSIVTSRVYPRL